MQRIVIIGGGILGASAAYHLAKAGLEVLIVDRRDNGQATDAAAGIICPWLSQRRNKAWYALAKGGAAYYTYLINQLVKEGETETGYRKVGAISIHTNEEKLEKIEKRALERREAAMEIGNVKKLSTTETFNQFPRLASEYASVFIEGAARVDGRALRDALMRGAEKYGAKIMYGNAKLSVDGNKVNGVFVDDTLHLASNIIVAVGAWAQELFTPLGFTVNVKGQKAQILHLKDENTDTSKWPVVIPPNDQYIVAFDGGKIVIGATHEDDKGFDVRPTVYGIYEVLDKALQTAPALADASVEEVRIGIRPFTPGFLPMFGPVPNYPEVLFANGLGASGLTVGPYIGKQLTHLILNEQTDVDVANYKVDDAFVENEQ